MNSESPKEKQESASDGRLPPLLYWGSIAALLGVCKLIEEQDRQIATVVFGVGLVVWVLWPILSSIIGKDLKETKDNVVSLAYLAGIVVVGLLVLTMVAHILPSSCTDNGNSSPADRYYRK